MTSYRFSESPTGAKEGYAVTKATPNEDRVAEFRQDVRERIRLRQAVATVLEEELTEAFGSDSYAGWEGRGGYRNGARERLVTSEAGTRLLRVARARLAQEDGSRREFRSERLPRFARRPRVVGELLLGTYLFGGSQQRADPQADGAAARRAAPSEERAVAGGSPAEGAVRGVGQEGALSQQRSAILFLDEFHLKVPLARGIAALPVPGVLGGAEGGGGGKVRVSLRPAATEAAGQGGRCDRRPSAPGSGLAAAAGGEGSGRGLSKALEAWPGVRVERCTRHPLVHFGEHCFAHGRAEDTRHDSQCIVNARDDLAARTA